MTIAAAVAAPALVLPADLTEPDRRRLRAVSEQASVSGQIRGEGFVLRGPVFEFLLDNPEFASHVTRALAINRYRVWREPEGLWLDDGRGAVGRLDVVYARAGTRIVHLWGTYKLRYLPSIRGEAVAVLEYVVGPADETRLVITPTLTGFIRIDSVFAALVSRIVHDAATAKAERVARRVVGDFVKTAHAIETDPTRVLEELRRRPDVPPRELAEFARLLD